MATKIWPKIHIQDGIGCHLESHQNGMLAHSKSRMVNIYIPTKFDADLHWRPGYSQKAKSNMAAAAILNYIETWISDLSNPHMANIYLPTQFDTNIFTDIRQKNKIQDGGRRHLEFPTNPILGPQ